MREYTKQIVPHLFNGLRKEIRQDRNEEYLHEAFNVRIDKTGLQPYLSIIDPFAETQGVFWPFPQIYLGEHDSLLLGAISIHRINKTTTPWTITEISAVAIDGISGNEIPSGGPWHIVDLKTSWYLFNGECVLAMIDGNDHMLLDRAIKINTGTHFNGRVVVGGISPSKIWSRGWHEMLSLYRNRDNMLPDIAADDVGSNYVMWSSIGGGDFPLWLFKPEIIHGGPIEQPTRDNTYRLPANESYAMDRIQQGQFGFMPMPFGGAIHAVRPLGKGVMVYGSEGIAYMPHVAAAEPAPTFGLISMTRVGIASRGAVGGNNYQHMFVDTSGFLWSINAELQLQRLGYQEWFEDMLGTDIVVSYDEHLKDFYISNDDICYLYSGGLSQVWQRPTSVSYLDGGLVGLFYPYMLPKHSQARVVSNVFDMGLRSIKTVTGVGVGISTEADVYVAVDYRYSKSESFQRTQFVLANKEGNVVLRVAGTEFRVVVISMDFMDTELDYIKVRWQSSDKRPIRGVSESEELIEQTA